jgi:hypothetical protein
MLEPIAYTPPKKVQAERYPCFCSIIGGGVGIPCHCSIVGGGTG